MACATQTQFRRGTAAANATFTGVEGEVTYATDTHRLYTHDGVTVGGFALALFSDIATQARLALSISAPLTYNSGTGAFAITLADSTHNGYLSSTDWSTFNAKQSATAPGADQQIIFNDGGVFGVDNVNNSFSFDKTTGQFTPNGSAHIYGDGSADFVGGSISFGSGASTIYSGAINFNPDGSASFSNGGVSFSVAGAIQATSDIANDPHALREDGSFTLNGLNMNTSGVIVTYNQNTTVANGLVSVVGFYDQATSANIALTTLFTPSFDGMYEVSVVRMITAAATSGNLDTNIKWTDEAGVATASLPVLSVGAVGRDSFTVIISATGTNAIKFETALSLVTGGPTTYRIKVSVRRIA